MKRGLVVILITMICATFACKSETTVTSEDLVGVWEVTSATRDGRTTETLNGAVFHFDAEGSMTTNISGEEDSGAYEMTDGVIVHQGNMSAQYNIESLVQDTMILVTQIQGRRFGFHIVRNMTE